MYISKSVYPKPVKNRTIVLTQTLCNAGFNEKYTLIMIEDFLIENTSKNHGSVVNLEKTNGMWLKDIKATHLAAIKMILTIDRTNLHV